MSVEAGPDPAADDWTRRRGVDDRGFSGRCCGPCRGPRPPVPVTLPTFATSRRPSAGGRGERP
jgi:hypothetical protein